MKKILASILLTFGIIATAYALPWYIAEDWRDKTVTMPRAELIVPDIKVTDDLVVTDDVTFSGDLTVTTAFTLTGNAKYAIATAASAGADLAGATTLTNPVTYVTGADGVTGVKPTAGSVGQVLLIVNVDAAALILYPPDAGAQINGGGAGNPVTVDAGERVVLFEAAADTWYGGVFVNF